MQIEAGDTRPGVLSRERTFKERGVVITLQDVGYSVKDSRPGDTKGQPLYLLKEVNGYFLPGQMSALMGPSGSGKTTLLDVMAGRKTVGKLEGRMRFSGFAPTPEYQRRYTGYVEQFDTLLAILTPLEMLMYTAELKRKLREPYSSKKAAVEELINLLALDTCKNVKIGNPMARGISGGQAKRTNIGIALITNPRVVFLDEPTTGLDSYTANEVMTVVQALSRTGVTIVCTIHSPTAYSFHLFDAMMQLVQGRVVYFGLQGPAALAFFQESCPHVKPFVDGYNDAEYLVDMITEADRFGKGGEFADAYAASSLAADCKARLAELEGQESEVTDELRKELEVSRSTETPIWWGLATFVKYRTRKNYQDPSFLAPRVFDKLTISMLVMTLYWNVGRDFSTENIINISAVLFMWSATTGFVAAGYMPALFLERGMYIRERADGLYLPITYLTAKMLDELMVSAVATAAISAATFYGIKLQGDLLLFWVGYFTAVSVGVILGYFVASFAPSLEVANALLPVYGVTLLFFAGFLIQLNDIPPYWKWYSYINFARYAWGANMINQFENNDILYIGGQTVLQYYGLDGVKSKWTEVGFVALFFIFFFVSTWAVLTYKRYNRR